MGNRNSKPAEKPANNTGSGRRENKKNDFVRLFTKRTNFIILLAIAVAGFVLLNLLAEFIPKIDTTTGGIFSITDTTKEVLGGLDSKVTIYALFDEVEGRADLNPGGRAEHVAILEKYEAFPNVDVEYVDLDRKPQFLENTVGDAAPNIQKNDFLVKCGDKVRHITSKEIYATDSSETDELGIPYIRTIGIQLETKLTSAIIKVTNETPVILYSTGFGEPKRSRYSHLLEYIGYNGYDIVDIDLNVEAIPENAASIIFMGPTKDLTGAVTETLSRWLQNGHCAYFFMDIISPVTEATISNDFTRFREIMKNYGIDIERTIIEESNEKKITGSNGEYLFQASTLTNGALSNLSKTNITVKNTRSLDLLKMEDNSLFECAALINTSKDAKVISFVNDNESYKGATIAASGTLYVGFATSNIVVFGSSQSFQNSFVEEYGEAGPRAIMNEAMRWMELDLKKNVADTIEAKQYNSNVKSFTYVTESKMKVIAVTVIVVLPLLIIIGGFVIWLTRRFL